MFIRDPEDERPPIYMGLAPGQRHETVTLVIDSEWLALADAKFRTVELSVILVFFQLMDLKCDSFL